MEYPLIKKALFNADINLVLSNDRCLLIVADVNVKSSGFRVAAVYTLNVASESVSYFRGLAPFLDNPKLIVLEVDWNAILYPKMD